MRRNDRGLVLPSWLVAVSAVLVALALVGFAVTSDRAPDEVAQSDAQSDAPSAGAGDESTPSTTPKADPGKSPANGKQKKKQKQAPPDRRTTYVEVYNASGITGLAAQTTATLRDSGWQVVATDNWYGEVPDSTVYYPADLANQARLLAADLGVERVLPAVEPMSFDRLTVVLTTAP